MRKGVLTFLLSVAVLVVIPAAVVLPGYRLHLTLGREALSNWGEYLTGTATLILSCGALVGLIQGLRKYRSKVSAEKAKWLFQLYEKLFENEQYKAIRRKLDYGETEEIKALIVAASEGREFAVDQQIKFDAFTDYLNFFEIDRVTRETWADTSSDIKAGFEYHLRLLTKQRNPEIRGYLASEGFENLDKLLKEYEG